MGNKYCSHNCGELTKDDVGLSVQLAGWVHRKRNHGKLLFVDLRDSYGIVQLVVEENANIFNLLSSVSNESVIVVFGKVVARDFQAINLALSTGEIEILINKVLLESPANILPFEVNSEKLCPEDLRLKYRFLDLRRMNMRNKIILRSNVIAKLRELMWKEGFMEFSTPILTSSSPEGARDFLVPSRIHKGKFYALPQAPQQFKQLLMISGFDKYFQIAPCFRDEDARADRSPGEFYQLDIEMSFVVKEDIFTLTENILYNIFKNFSKKNVTKPSFPRITYKDAINLYGTDKPDLRNPLLISDVTDIFADSGFSIFEKNIKNGMLVKAIPAPKTALFPRSFFDQKINFVKSLGGSGLAYVIIDNDGIAKGPIVKLLNSKTLESIKNITNIGSGDAVFFSCEIHDKVIEIGSSIRTHLGDELNLLSDEFAFCWIVDFPFYQRNKDTGNIEFFHNPFSMPKGGMNSLLTIDSLEIIGEQYDIVCNGIELSSGAIRNHKLDVLYKAFEIAGYSSEMVNKEFSALVRALCYGAPPHGGIAPGIDRIMMLLTESENIREVVCFPQNQKAEDLLMDAPSVIRDAQLKELGIILKKDLDNKQ